MKKICLSLQVKFNTLKMLKIISLTGDLGSGKSTVSNLLIKQLGYDYIYTGKIQREIAGKYNMTTLELNKYAETHPEIDEEIDSTFKSLNNSTDLIVDSRLAWFFVPKSFKIFLKTNIMVSANRISGDKLRKSEKYSSTEEAVKHIIARKTSENKRYMDLYGANCSDLSNFNLIIDTSFISPGRVAEIILSEYRAWLVSGECSKAFISPVNLYPIKYVREFDKEKNILNDILNSMKTNGYNTDFPVSITNQNSFDYIVDGHKRVSCAIKSGIDLIPAIYPDTINTNPVEYIRNEVEPNLFFEWEKFNSFSYLVYPIR